MAKKRGKQTLYQRIALEGGEELRKEMEALGPEGAKAFKLIQQAVDKSNKELSGFQKLTLGVRRDLDTIGVGAKLIGSQLGIVPRQLGTISQEATILAAKLALVTGAITGVVGGLFLLTKAGSEAADAAGKAAQSTGLGIAEYQKLQFAFEQGDISADQFQTAMKRVNTVIDEAARGVGASAETFERLGINVKNADGSLRSADEIIADVADRFAKMPDGVVKSALAVELFGRAGATMIPTLNEGGAAMRALAQDAVDLGLVFTEAQAKIGDEFGDSLNEMNRAIQGVRNQVGLSFAPAFTEAFTAITELIKENKDELIAFSQVIASDVAPLVRDVVSILKGDDAAVVNQGLLQIRDTIVGIGQAFQTIGSIVSFVFQTLEGVIQPFVDIFNFVFGTNVTAQAALLTIAITALTGGFRVLGALIKSIGLIWQGLVLIFGTTTAQVVGFIVGIDVALNAIAVALEGFAAYVAGGFVAAWQAAVDAISAAFEGLLGPVQSVIDTIAGWVQGLLKLVQDLIAAIFGAQSASSGDSDSGPDAQKNAAGGPIRGKGTGTSDSILSWLSNGEFVVRAAAVRKYGLGMLNALNGMSLPRFATGGLVPDMPRMSLTLPALASGGPVVAGRPLSLTLGGETFDGLIAPEQVATKFVKYATSKKLKSTGSRPGWMR
jgi:hypothetical protein